MDHHSLGYGAHLHCSECAGDEPLVVEDAWWEDKDLHLLHYDGTVVVIEDAEKRGYSKEEIGEEAKDSGS